MRKDVARRDFAALLIACFAALAFLCVQGNALMGLNAEVRHERVNSSIYIEQREDGVLFVGGEGKLYGADMLALVESLGNKNDVRHMVIGDGITWLGSDALNEFEGLRTLWLGRGMKEAANGSLKWCTALQYVFLPSGLERVGRDFLYGCKKCTVVTDAALEDLPKLRNTSNKRVLERIDSYDALAAALGEDAKLPAAMRQWWP